MGGSKVPTIVVVGDQSSGKSSVLESLAGISLPRGPGICTRVPLVMKLQRSPNPDPEIWLEFGDKRVNTDEEHITEAICTATEEIAGSGKGVSDTPLTLHVKKHGILDLTMVDLPGIARVPLEGQPEDIYEQISAMIMKYIEPQETIILNVLSATVDFTTCESIRMSRQVDKTGERTLAVVTKADIAPDGLLEKVTENAVKIGLGYVCVRNRVGQETLQEARMKEELLFKTHPLLSMIHHDIVGIPVLAQKLIHIQEMMIISSAKESLLRILIQGDFTEFPSMHSTDRLADLRRQFAENLQAKPQTVTEFLMWEIEVLQDHKCLSLLNFNQRLAFLCILRHRIDEISAKPVEYINKIWEYIEVVVSSVLTKHTDKSSIKRAGRNLISKMKEECVNRVEEILEMERLTDYTCSPQYMTVYRQKIVAQENFINHLKAGHSRFGDVEISHLRKHDAHLLRLAFEMNVSINAYWPIVVCRIVDHVALYVNLLVDRLVNSRLMNEIVVECDSKKRGSSESLSLASKRKKLKIQCSTNGDQKS